MNNQCSSDSGKQVLLIFYKDETRSLLAQLMEQERSKGYSIPVLPQDIVKLKQVRKVGLL